MQNAAGKQHTMSELTPQEIKDTQENRMETRVPVACPSNKVKLIMTAFLCNAETRVAGTGTQWNQRETMMHMS